MSIDAATPNSDQQKAITELHKALWLALWMNGGEVVALPHELARMPEPGCVEWLTADDGATKIIRIGDEKIRARAL